jgi:hypothetical protein
VGDGEGQIRLRVDGVDVTHSARPCLHRQLVVEAAGEKWMSVWAKDKKNCLSSLVKVRLLYFPYRDGRETMPMPSLHNQMEPEFTESATQLAPPGGEATNLFAAGSGGGGSSSSCKGQQQPGVGLPQRNRMLQFFWLGRLLPQMFAPPFKWMKVRRSGM